MGQLVVYNAPPSCLLYQHIFQTHGQELSKWYRTFLEELTIQLPAEPEGSS